MQSNNFNRKGKNIIYELSKLPVIRKTDLKNNFNEIIDTNIPLSERRTAYTSGSTELPFKIFNDLKREVPHTMAAASIALEDFGLNHFSLFNKLNIKFDPKGTPLLSSKTFLNKFKNYFGASYSLSSVELHNTSKQKVLSSIIENRIKLVYGYSQSVYYLLRMIEDSIDKTSITHVMCLSEPLFAEQREYLEKKMGIKVSLHYGSTECMRLAFDSGIPGEYRVDLINHHVETSKKNNEIIVTNLNNFCFPFIRYAIGDLGTLVNSEEMRFPILKDIEGRSGIFILNTLGNKFNTSGFSIFFMHQKYNYNESNKFVKRFQIIQNEDLSLDVNLEMEPNFDSEKDYIDRAVKDLRNYMRDEKMKITVNFDPILPGSNGKFQNFISKVNNKEEYKFE